MTESVIIIEIHTNDQWVEIGRLSRDDQPGTMTDGEQMLLFGWFLRGPTKDELSERPLVTISKALVSIGVGRDRILAPGDSTVLADLTDGPYQRLVHSAAAICVRWSVVEV